MAALGTISTILTVVGTAVSAISSFSQAKAIEKAGRVQQQYAIQEAGQERALAQRTAIEQRRQGRYVSSRAQALAAASGAGALDPTIVNILGDIDTESEIRALDAIYSGEQRGRRLEFEGNMARSVASSDANALRGRAIGNVVGLAGNESVLKGGQSLWEKYRPAPSLKPAAGYQWSYR